MCKAPTQEFFARDMHIPLHMEPDYEDFSCTFTFGKEAPPLELDSELTVPCFLQCPTAGALRKQCHYVPAPSAALEGLLGCPLHLLLSSGILLFFSPPMISKLP